MYKENLTQEEQILKLLRTNKEISSLDIVIQTYILQYNARIWGLRKKGYKIACEIRRITNRFGEKVKVGYYTLTE